jgi:hypothetical protein
VNWSLLKFPVSLPTGCTVKTANLRLTVGSNTDDKSVYGGDLYGTTNSWSESSVTWNGRPAATSSTPISSVAGAVALNTSYLFNVTPLVTGSGTVSMELQSPNSDGARYFSKEAGTATAPQLQVTCA